MGQDQRKAMACVDGGSARVTKTLFVDFNGDGGTDILWENVGSGDRGMWIMDRTVPAAWINLPSIALDWRIAE